MTDHPGGSQLFLDVGVIMIARDKMTTHEERQVTPYALERRTQDFPIIPSVLKRSSNSDGASKELDRPFTPVILFYLDRRAHV